MHTYTTALRTETLRSIRYIMAVRRDLYGRAWVRQWYVDRGFLTTEENRRLYRLDILRSVLGDMRK